MQPDGGQMHSFSQDWLSGGGLMGQLTQEFDWSKTSLGPVEQWPQSLKTAIAIMLTSRYPMLIWWGQELIHFYNDAYAPVLGKRHPSALGQPAPDVWSEAWPTVGPMADQVMGEGVSTWSEELPILMTRNGYPEEVYMTFSYSPLRDETGSVAGLFCTCTEETQRVLGRRRLRTLRSLAEQTARAKSSTEAITLAAAALSDNPHDVPFAMVYLLDEDRQRAILAGSVGIDSTLPASATDMDLRQPHTFWPFDLSGRRTDAYEVTPLPIQVEPNAGSVLPKSPERALILPITRAGHEAQLTGWLVAGIAPLRSLDADYRSFLELVAGQLETALTNTKAYEEERKRAEALAEIDRVKTTFFSNVSHEFRTPLTLMLGPLEDLLSHDELPPEVRESLTIVFRNSQRLLKLVNTLLDFSRIEAERIEAFYEPVDLASLTIDLASVFRSTIERAGLQLQMDCPPLSQPVYVDREMWEKIVLNLLSNAFKFTFEGTITVKLAESAEFVTLLVQDTGTGIPAQELPHLFERFHRVKGARGRSYEGSGIGLALVQELVRLHGGQLGVESEPERGSVFSVTIPLGKSHLPAESLAQQRQLASTGTASTAYVDEALRWLPSPITHSASNTGDAGGQISGENSRAFRHRVLLVDDNADMRAYIERLLRPYYLVNSVPDGLAALAAIDDQAYDLVLTDVMMPQLDGFEFLAALREKEQGRTLPVIFLSARAGEESRLEGLQAGANDYLIKPFSARELLARVAAQINIQQEGKVVVTGLKEKLRRFIDTSSDMLYEVSADWSTMHFFTGKGYLTDLQGQGAWLDQYIPQEDQPQVLKAIQTAIDTSQPFELEHRIRRANGNLGWVHSRAQPVWDQNGKVKEWFGIATDITSRKSAEHALKEADRRKDEFLAMLAHELRNPMSAIYSGIGILELTVKDAMVRSTVDMMSVQTKHLVRMVDDLLDVSRITQGKIELKKVRVDFVSLVVQAIDSVKQRFKEQNKTLSVDIPSSPLETEGDPTRLVQVVVNLLTNSLRYSGDQGQVWLKLTLQHDSLHGHQMVLQVKDNGIGLAPDQLSSIFDLFVQVDNSLARAKGGLGLGLTLVKRIVEMHDGRVEAQSEGLGKGSTFTVYLPTLTQEIETGSRRHVARVSPSAPTGILIIDDNVDSASSLSMLLRLKKYEVQVRNSGPAGIEAAGQLMPAAILLDIGMPEMDGYETCRLLRRQPGGRTALIIAISGYGREEDQRKALEAGFDAHLVKPVNLEALELLLAKLRGNYI